MTGWNIGTLGRTRTGPARSLRAHPAALRCHTTRYASCPRCRRPPRCPRRSLESPSSALGTLACHRPPSLRSTPQPVAAPQNPPRTTREDITIVYSFKGNASAHESTLLRYPFHSLRTVII